MKNNTIVPTFLILAVLFWPGSDVSAFSVDTHRSLNERATLRSTVDDYLRVQLGLSGGLGEEVAGRRTIDWFREGGAAEDEFLGIEFLGAAFRSRHHFHNPLLPWDQAGLNATSICPPFFLSGEASVRWAQDPNQGLSGQAAWRDARKSFLQALTLPSKTERDSAFAQTFQILGQQMHLIADLAAPAHTRNDAHCPSPDGFEAWAAWNGSLFQDPLGGPLRQRRTA